MTARLSRVRLILNAPIRRWPRLPSGGGILSPVASRERSYGGKRLARALLLVTMALAGQSQAQVNSVWTGGGDGISWSDAANWSNGVPGSVSFNASIDGGDVANSAVVTGTSVTRSVGSLTIDSGDSLTVQNAANLRILTDTLANPSSGNLTNNGLISITTSGNSTDLVIDGAVNLGGSGVIVLGGSNLSSRIVDESGADGHLTNSGNQIEGKGQIGVNTLQITNQAGGTIDANVAGQTLTIDPNAAGLANQGVMRASGGGNLVLSNGTFDNTSGNIEAADGSQVTLTGAVVSGGTLSSTGTGSFEVTSSSSASLSGLTIDGTISQSNASNLLLNGTIENLGSILVTNGGSSTDLVIDSTTSLTGGGVVTLGGVNTFSRVVDESGNDGVLTNGNNTIQGKGQIGNNTLRVINQAGGLILANDSTGTLTIDPANTTAASGGQFVNEGTLRASGNAELVLTGSGGGQFLNSGGLVEALDGSTVRLTAGATVIDGTLQTSGTGQLVVSASSSATLQDVTNLGVVNTENASNLFLGGSIDNQGNVNVLNNGSSTDLVIDGATQLSGSGTIVLGGLNNSSRVLDESGANGVLTNVDNTIQGKGQIGVNTLQVVNQAGGLIDANDAGGTLTLDPNSAALVNQGTLRASGGGHLVLTSGSFNNTGGTIQAADGSTVTITGSAIVESGTLLSTGSGVFEVPSSNTATLTEVTINGTINQRNASNLLLGGAINNQGNVNVLNSGSNTDLVIDGATSLSGGGTIVLGGFNTSSRIVDESGANGVLTNVDNTIQGKGQIGVNSLQVVNQTGGLIDANDAGGTLTLDPNSAALINQGTLRASGGGQLVLTSGSFNNTGGTIQAADGSTVTITGSAIVESGTLLSTGSGVFEVPGASTATLTEVTINGTINQRNATNLLLGGAINNQGSVNVLNNGSNTDLVIDGATSLSGGGTIALGGFSTSSRIVDESGIDGVLTNVDNTIRGYGQVGTGSVEVINQAGGTIAADVNGRTLTYQSRVANTNQGTFAADNGGTLAVLGDLANDGTIRAGAGSVVSVTGDITNSVSSLLAGSGEIDATNIVHSGSIAPGASAGQLTLDANVQVDQAIFELEFGATSGTAGIDWDFIDVLGTLDLSGATMLGDLNLQISSLDAMGNPGMMSGFNSADDYSWEIISAGSLVGFDAGLFTVNSSGFSNPHAGQFSVSSLGDTISLNYTGAVAVPEPGSVSLLALGLGSTLLVRRRRV